MADRLSAAEHSWHLALGLAVVVQELDLKIDLQKALVMALIHDTCEIDAGDTPVYGPDRPDQHDAELRCIQRLAAYGLVFSNWREQSVSRSQVLRVSEPVREYAPEIYEWMIGRIDGCVKAGWLRDA